MIEIQSLYKTYNRAIEPSVKNLNLSFGEGKICGLLGPNGAGKTTSISIICGLIKNYEGIVRVFGFDPQKDSEQIKRKIGVVPQQIALFPTLSAEENFRYIAALYGIKSNKQKEIIAYFLNEFGLYSHRDKAIQHYSGGMKRRANIIAALLHDPDLLILDEPTAGVDVQSRNMIIQFLKNFNARGKSIIYTSHLLDEAQQLCNEVAIIDNGELVIQGIPDVLIREKNSRNLEELFLSLTGRFVRD